jgi:hypothetical protein
MYLAGTNRFGGKVAQCLAVFKIGAGFGFRIVGGYGVPLLTLTDDPETEPSPYLKDRQTLGHFAAKNFPTPPAKYNGR